MSESPALSRPSAPRWAEIIGTFFYIGFLKPGPGTWAALATAIIWWFTLARLRWTAVVHTPLVSPTTIATAVAALLVTLIGIPAGTAVARAWHKKDPSQVVIDEVAGQLVTLIACPIFRPDVLGYLDVATWKPALAAFILFRAFDILKPPPVRQLERLPEGTGIMLDDIGAGIYAWIVLHLLLHYGFLR
jgi:phosphatidylglycerophosphatase A